MTITRAVPAALSSEQAAWIREHAWTKHHRRTFAEIPTFYSMCACQGGPCGYCARLGRHRRCTHEQHTPWEVPAGHVINQRGHVVANLWEAGHRHTWICSCKTAGHDGTLIQDTLF